MILNADAQHIPLADQSVHCVVTSPPYWGLRDYGVSGQLGLERTPEEYVAALVAVFREVWRVLRDDGTLWLNLGDSYNGYMANQRATSISANNQGARPVFESGRGKRTNALSAKDLVGVPWRVAFALQADGWVLRSDIIWSKPNPMPESVTDRPTKAHEYLFLLAKRERYYYDAEAIKEAGNPENWRGSPTSRRGNSQRDSKLWERRAEVSCETRNRRTVWEIATQPYPEAHFATFPEALVEPCVLAGTSERGVCRACGAPWRRITSASQGDAYKGPARDTGRPDGAERRNPRGGQSEWDSYVPRETTGWAATCACAAPTTRPLVLDPFAGSGTVGQVCHRLGRRFVGLELKPDYCAMAYKRTAQMGLV